jgi:16S rRNA A1518/A1519 N6-dimethyltransferase RsmA/KsgA/DIM1 with predicted DNA glycosylase/AP lyase activity
MDPQVSKNTYFGLDYLTRSRFGSYYHQLSEILRCQRESVLEIGIGNGLISFMLRKTGPELTTLDFDESLKPDIRTL